MKPSEALRAVKRRLEPESAWTKGARARNVDDKPISPLSQYAVCWCLDGALAIEQEDDSVACMRAVGVLEATLGMTIVGFNDSRKTGHRDVHAVLDLAILQADLL